MTRLVAIVVAVLGAALVASCGAGAGSGAGAGGSAPRRSGDAAASSSLASPPSPLRGGLAPLAGASGDAVASTPSAGASGDGVASTDAGTGAGGGSSPPPPAAAAPVTDAQAPASPARTQPPPQVRAQVQQMEAEIAAIEGFRALLTRVGREMEALPDGTTPVACTSNLRDTLSGVIRDGRSYSSDAGDYRRRVDDLCGGFERWSHPDESLETRIRSYLDHLGRIEGWMRDILGCTGGHYDARCENAYGPEEPEDQAAARDALATVARVRQELRGVPGRQRFPCRSPLWGELAARRWSTSTTRAQMPDLGRNALHLCESIQVDTETVARKVREAREEIARDDAMYAQTVASRQSSITQLRAIYEL